MVDRNCKRGLPGFTLFEVIFSLVILSIVALASFQFITFSIRMSVRLQELSQLYFASQDKMEAQRNQLSRNADRIAKVEKEQGPEAALTEEEALMSDAIKREMEVFGENVTVYNYQQVTNASNMELTLIGGVVKRKFRDYPVPILADFKIKGPNGETDSLQWDGTKEKDDENKPIMSIQIESVTYSDVNSEYKLGHEFYYWYIASPTEDDQPPVFDDGWSLLTDFGSNSRTIHIHEEDVGKFITCSATPLSTNGKMGERIQSNTIFITE